MYRVHRPFVNPFVFNLLRFKEPRIEATVLSDGKTVECCGDEYTIVDEGVWLPPGEKVWFCIYNRNFHIERKEDHQRRSLQQLADKWRNKPESYR
jgi:hypothetical protein